MLQDDHFRAMGSTSVLCTREDDDVSVEEGDNLPATTCRRLLDAGFDSGTAMLAVALAMHLPPDFAVYAAAGLPSLLTLTLGEAWRRLTRLIHHVEAEGYDFDNLVAGCAGDEKKAQLVLRTIEAARAVEKEQQLRALARSFVEGATSTDPITVDLDTAIVRVVGALDDAHVRLLELFTRTQFDLFGIRFPSGEPVLGCPESLRRYQIVFHLGSLTDHVIDRWCGELVARGLLRTVATYNGADESWALTALGSTVASRLQLVGQAEASAKGE